MISRRGTARGAVLLAAVLALAALVSLAAGQTAPPDSTSASAPTSWLEGNIERILNSSDSLSFSDSRIEDETIVEPDKGTGIVKGLLSTSFGDTALADWLFRRKAIIWLVVALALGGLVVAYRWGGSGSVELPMAAAAGTATFPVVGEDHPVGRASMSLSRRAAGWAIMMHLLLFGLWLVARQLPQPPPPTRRVRLITVSELGAPPSLSGQTPPPTINVAQAIAPPSIGLPEPVPDFLADVQTLATDEELSAIQTTDLSGLGEGDLQVVGDIGGTGQDESAGNNFQPLGEELPVLLSMPKPVYPETARAADVSGTVILDILVDTDGTVKDVRIFKGHPMLNEAALAAARGAKFKPAKQGKMSVPVWVQFPMRFSLY